MYEVQVKVGGAAGKGDFPVIRCTFAAKVNSRANGLNLDVLYATTRLVKLGLTNRCKSGRSKSQAAP